MLTTLTLFGLLMAFALMLGAEAPAANLTPAEDDDEKELIASVGEGTAAKPKPKEDDAEDDDESEDEPEGDEPEVVETAAADDAADAPAPESAGVGGGSGGAEPVSGVLSPKELASAAGSDEPTGVVPQPDPDAFNADPIIKRLDSAIEKIEKNELIEDYEKETKIAALLEHREGRVTKLADGASKAENQFRNNKARELGITRAQLDQAWSEALTETHKTLGKHSHDAAMLVLTQRAQAMKKVAPKNGHTTPAPAKPAAPKAVAPTPITPQGARVAPPPAIVPPPPKKLTDEQELVESVRKAQKSGVRV